MPNFELIFKKVIRVWRREEVIKELGEFRRVIVAPDLDLAQQIAGAMCGEQLRDIPGWEVISIMPTPEEQEKIKFNDLYEVGIGFPISITETTQNPTLGDANEFGHPIPNDDYIWRRVSENLNWYWFKGVVVEFSNVEKRYNICDTKKIDGVLVKDYIHPLVLGHKLGVVAIHKGNFNSYEEAQRFLMARQADRIQAEKTKAAI